MRKSSIFLLSCSIMVAIAMLMTAGTHAQTLDRANPTPSPTPLTAVMPHAVSAGATPMPITMAPQERLSPPAFSDPPTQVELGHHDYYLSCMVCHGDRGQGLTEEWRSLLDPADQNCWQSKCHAPNHPPEGFEIPRQSPAIIGPGSLASFQTAADLFAYIRVAMPWAFPGLFEDEAYWQLTAYLVDVNQIDYGQQTLGPDNAGRVLMRPQLLQTHHTDLRLERLATTLVLALLVGALVLQWLSRGRL